MGVPRPGFMEPRQRHTKGDNKWPSILLVALLAFSLMPTVTNPASADDEGRAINVTVSISPSAQTVNPGETAEYTVTVRNFGSDPVTVQLSAANDQDCNGYSATVGQIPGAIDSGSSEETFLNVTLSQTAEDSCVTTVTAVISEQVTPPTQPEQKEATATTTAGDGAGSTLFGVDLILDGPGNINWNGESSVTWDVEVENTGRVQETVDLTVDTRSGSGCFQDGSFSIDVEPSQVTIDNGSSEWVTVTLDVPDGKDARKYCWEVKGVVTGDQNPNGSAEDTEDISLNIPELKKCIADLSKTSMSIKPDETGSLTATFENDGNTAWSINVGFNGTPSGWSVSVEGSSSGNLALDGEKEFTIDITPTDSIDANTQRTFYIEGKDGNTWKCRSSISITVGQSRGATMSLGNLALYDAMPGQSQQTTLTVTNQGNGQDTFRVSSTSPPTGWAVSFESSTITTGSKHSNEKSGTIDVTISLPSDALATEEVVLTFSVLPTNGGGAYATQDLTVRVKAVHGMSATASSDEQMGSSQTEVEFPITVNNDGNTLDRFKFTVISQTANPAWSKYFKTDDNQVMSELDIDARSSATVYLVVTIPNCDSDDPLDCEYENSQMTVRITNMGDNNNGDGNSDGIPDNQIEFKFKSILSNRQFSMDGLIMISSDELTRGTNFILPPSGEKVFKIKVINTGDATDEAVFEITGLSGIATRSLNYRGMPVTGPITIHKGWGAYNNTTESFYQVGNAPAIASNEDKVFEDIIEPNGLVQSHYAREYYAVLELVVTVNSGSENGDGGLLEVIVTSESNSADRTGRMTFSLSVESVMEIDLNLDGDVKRDLTFGKIGDSQVFEIELSNTGNVESEVRVFHSGGLRGWTIILGHETSGKCKGADELICTLSEGESVIVTAKVSGPSGDNNDVADSFTFTLSAEPTEIGLVGRQNLELTVEGQPEEFGLNSLITPNVLYGISALVLLGLALLLLKRRN